MVVHRTLTAAELALPRLPSVSEIAQVAASIPQLEVGTWRQWDARPAPFLEVAPGMIRLYRTAAHLPDAARDRAIYASYRDQSQRIASDRALYGSPMALLSDGDLTDVGRQVKRKVTVRHGKITGWSRRSRARMQMQLQRLDYNPLFQDGLEPAMVTLTMPGEWESLAPTPAAFKRMVDNFTRAYRDAWGRRIYGVWKLEFQRRGAPHVHILMTPPAGVAKGAFEYEFKLWLSHAWARAVGSTGEQLEKHLKAGTGVDYVGEQYRDPQRISRYFGKHGFFGEKEYQNEMPQLWRDAIANGERGARFWGVWGLEKASAVLQLDDHAEQLELDAIAEEYRVAYEAEERRQSSDGTGHDPSCLRAAQRFVDAVGSLSPDDIRVQRFMRKLSKSLAMRGQPLERNKHGQLVLARHCSCEWVTGLDGKRRQVGRRCSAHVVVRMSFDAVDRDTGEVKRRRRYRIGYYRGGSGFLIVKDGCRTAANLARVLRSRARNWTADHVSGFDAAVSGDLVGPVTVDRILSAAVV